MSEIKVRKVFLESSFILPHDTSEANESYSMKSFFNPLYCIVVLLLVLVIGEPIQKQVLITYPSDTPPSNLAAYRDAIQSEV